MCNEEMEFVEIVFFFFQKIIILLIQKFSFEISKLRDSNSLPVIVFLFFLLVVVIKFARTTAPKLNIIGM